MQSVALAQEIPSRWLDLAPLGLGVGCTTQLVPFQRSARVTSVPEPSTKYPTAVQVSRAGQDTPSKRASAFPFGLATLLNFTQPAPALRRARGRCAAPSFS